MKKRMLVYILVQLTYISFSFEHIQHQFFQRNYLLHTNSKLLNIKNRILSQINHMKALWPTIADRARYLENEHHKKVIKNLVHKEIARQVPLIRDFTDKCLLGTLLSLNDTDYCNLNQVNKNVQLLCLFENSGHLNFEEYFRRSSRKEKIYMKYCWLVYAIVYLEECHVKIFKDNCEINKIELFIKLIYRKLKNIEQFLESNPYYINSLFFYYVSRFKDLSMRISFRILLIIEYILSDDENRNRLSLLEMKNKIESLIT